MVTILDMALLIVIIVLVNVTMTYGKSVVDSGVTQQEYKIYPNCSVFIPVSEVELYHKVIEKATKLVFVHFKYNGTQLDVVKVLNDKAKYLLTLGNNEDYATSYIKTFIAGIEEIDMTLSTTSCFQDTDSERFIISALMVSQDFNKTSIDFNTGSDCLDSKYWVFTEKGYLDICLRTGEINESINNTFLLCFNAMFLTLSVIVLNMSHCFSKKNTVSLILYSECTAYKLTSDDAVRVAENDNFLIGEHNVPKGIISILFDILFPSIYRFYKYSPTESLSGQHVRSTFHVLAVTLPFILLDAVVDSASVKMVLGVLMLFLIVNVFPLQREFFDFLKFFMQSNTVNIEKESMGRVIGFIIWLMVCVWTSFILTKLITITCIAFVMDPVPYWPFVMASILDWQMISERLSNWYKFYLKEVLDISKSKVNTNVADDLQPDYLLVQLHKLIRSTDHDNHLEVAGSTIFVRKGTFMLTKTFFNECVRIDKNYTFVIECVWKLIYTNIVLIFAAYIITIFGQDEQLTKPITMIAGGFIPFILNMTNRKHISLPSVTTDAALRIHVNETLDLYVEKFKLVIQP